MLPVKSWVVVVTGSTPKRLFVNIAGVYTYKSDARNARARLYNVDGWDEAVEKYGLKVHIRPEYAEDE